MTNEEIYTEIVENKYTLRIFFKEEGSEDIKQLQFEFAERADAENVIKNIRNHPSKKINSFFFRIEKVH